jgi:hypothetical protein
MAARVLVSIKMLVWIVLGIAGASLVGSVVTYVLLAVSFMKPSLDSLLPYAPSFMLVGLGVGIVTRLRRIHGCLTLIGAGVGWLVGIILFLVFVAPLREGRIDDSFINGPLLAITVGLGGTLTGVLLAMLLSWFLSALRRDLLDQAARDQAR